MRLLHWLRGLLSVFCVTLMAILGLLVCAAFLSVPDSDEHADIPGLSAPVRIGFDADGVPRIQAASANDAAAALGFIHARDRLFQMEMMRRAASGRLSEVFGKGSLPYDRMMRVLGLRRLAEADFPALPAETRAILDAYAAGVNSWITAHGRFSAPEFLLIGHPEPWTPVDSLLWGKTMGIWLSDNWRTELGRLSLSGKLSDSMIAELWPPVAQAGHPEARLDEPGLAALAARLTEALPSFPGPFTLPDRASNEWAVDGRHSATGAPLLAGDPHLSFGMPGIWYLARIETPTGVLAGATAPGVPFLVIGRNSHIAWTFTTTGADTQDLFIEKPGDQKALYQTPDGPRPFALREERIRVRGFTDEILTVRETRHGPVISDLDTVGGMLGEDHPTLALSAANLQPGDTGAAGLLALNRAETVDDAARAAALISAPVQNLLVADRTRIGLALTGRVPIRRSGDGGAPVSGADGAHDWTGFASGGQLPGIMVPPSGRLVNANERIAPSDFPVFMGRDWFGDYRAIRIRQMLDASDKQTAAGFARMQTDVGSDYAHRLLPALRGIHPGPGPAADAAALMATWDGVMRMDLPQPLIFNEWLRRFRDLVLTGANVKQGPAVSSLEFVAFVLSPSGAHWCGGDCGPLLTRALEQTVKGLTDQFGADPKAWRWGEAHKAVFGHLVFGRVPVIGDLTSAIIDSPGDDTTVDRGGTFWIGLRSIHGASYRGVYDLANLDRSLFIVAPGQSGNVFRFHSRDFLRRWRDGDTITLGPATGEPAETVSLNPAPNPATPK